MPKKITKGTAVYDIRFTLTQESILGQILEGVPRGQYSSMIRELAVMGATLSIVRQHGAALGSSASSEYGAGTLKNNIEQPSRSAQEAAAAETKKKATSQNDKGSSLATESDPEPEIFRNFDPSVLKFKIPKI